MGGDRLRVTLEVDLRTDPVRSALRRAGGGVRRFDGWIQLVHALHAEFEDARRLSPRSSRGNLRP